MVDLERFESEFAAALRAYGDEATIDVEPFELAQSIAVRHPRRHWFDGLGIPTARPAMRLARAALVVTALLLLLAALAIIGQRNQSPSDIVLSGTLACVRNELWVPEGTRLNCRLELSDERATGRLVMTVVDSVPSRGTTAAIATVELRTSFEGRTSSETWEGELIGQAVENGVASADIVLNGSGHYEDLILHLHLVSADGLTWRAIGTIEREGT